MEIVEAGRRKTLELRIEVPVEDMARLSVPADQTGPAAAAPAVPSIWPSIHPRLVELIRQHRSTMIFVNSRRLAERLAAAINELAEEEMAAAHHGSIAKDTRLSIEDRLKRGQLPAIVATSSLELGIDMGAVDLVIQIEAPPSIASGIQRIGRAGHQVERTVQGHHLSQVSRRSAGLQCRHGTDAAGRSRGDVLPAQSARRAGPAARGHGGA